MMTNHCALYCEVKPLKRSHFMPVGLLRVVIQSIDPPVKALVNIDSERGAAGVGL